MADCHTRAGDFANVFKAFIGTNYLSMPYGFLISGLGLAVVGLLIVAVFTDYSCVLIVRCKHILIEKLCQEYGESISQCSKRTIDKKVSHLRCRLRLFLDFGDLVNLTWGRWGVYVVNFCIVVTQAGFCMNYFIVIGNTMQTLFPLVLSNVTEAGLPQQLIPLVNSSNNAVITSGNMDVPRKDPGVQVVNRALAENTTQYSNNTETMDPLHPALIYNDTVPQSYLYVYESRAWPLPLLVILPLPIMVVFALFRTVRQLSIVSVIANTCLCTGFASAVLFLAVDFRLSEGIQWCVPSGLLVYIGQATGAFEAVALILPIEASMTGNHKKFRPFLHGTLVLVTTIILVMSLIGYLSFGPDTQQIILLNLPLGDPVTMTINVLLMVAIACTYPLQIIPVIQIMEGGLFGEKGTSDFGIPKSLGDSSKGETTPLISSNSTSPDDIETDDPFQLSVAYHVPKTIATWKRNLLRILITMAICAMAVLLRNVLVYSLALIGALGSCPLGYILPGMVFLKLNYQQISKPELVLNIIIMIFGSFFCVVGVVLAVKNIIEKA